MHIYCSYPQRVSARRCGGTCPQTTHCTHCVSCILVFGIFIYIYIYIHCTHCVNYILVLSRCVCIYIYVYIVLHIYICIMIIRNEFPYEGRRCIRPQTTHYTQNLCQLYFLFDGICIVCAYVHTHICIYRSGVCAHELHAAHQMCVRHMYICICI